MDALGIAKRTYSYGAGGFTPTPRPPPVVDSHLQSVIIGLPQKDAKGRMQKSFITMLTNKITITEDY